MLEYILKTSICWAAFYALYFLFLRKETFFRTNRVYLLLTLCLGAIIPLLENIIPVAPTETITLYLAPIDLDIINDSFVVTPDKVESSYPFLTWHSVLYGIYVAGLLIALSRFTYGLNKIYRLYSNAEVQSLKSYCMVHTRETHLPFSFFNMMFLNKAYDTSEEDTAKIILHEKAHIEARHSFDIILLELFAIIFWCSPLIYLYRKSIKAVHEYMADEKVLQTTSTLSYGHLLLSHSQAGMQVAMANHFIHSLIKQRIIMMTRNKSNRKNLLKYILALPIIIVLLILLSDKTNSNVNAQTSSSIKNQESQIDYSIKGDNYPTVIARQIASKDIQFSDPIYTYNNVDQMPRFPGCEDNWCTGRRFVNFISENIKYPEQARKSKIEGTVLVSAIIGKFGKLSEAKVIQKVGGGCDEEALRVTNLLPDFIPGEHEGELVDVVVNLPFRFELENDSDHIEAVLVSEKDTSRIYKVVEQMPRFPGCEDLPQEERKSCSQQKMLEFIYTNIKYPAEARTSNIQGTIVIRFVVLKNGKLDKLEAIRKIGGGCDEEALKVVGSMPVWIPGKHNGEVVEVQYNLPIRYKLQEETKVEQPTELNINTEPKPKFLSENPEDGKPPYKVVEQMPRFPGCEDLAKKDRGSCSQQKMLEFLYSNLKYPVEARTAGIQGTTVIRFVVKSTGELSDFSIVRNIAGGCGQEALRVVKLMPNWIPGMLRGQKVDVQYNVPIKFKLNDEEKTENLIYDEDYIKVWSTMVESGSIGFLFPGCEDITEQGRACSMDKMQKFINENLVYPNEAASKNISGTVKVKFTLDNSGNVINAKVVEGLGASFDKEALRLINMMPQWKVDNKTKSQDVSVSIQTNIDFKIGKQ